MKFNAARFWSLPVLLVSIVCWAQLVHADMGQIHTSDAVVRESSQKAVILHNGVEEILVLGTDLRGDHSTGLLRFIPFPTEPRVSLAPGGFFDRVSDLLKQLRLQFLTASKGGGTEQAAVELLLHERLGAHDMTVVKVHSAKDFSAWVNAYFVRRGLPTQMEYAAAEAIVADYLKRGFPYFVLDYVEVTEETRFIDPVVYRFASPTLYYPLKTSNTFGGQGAIDLVLLLPGTLCQPSLGAYDTCLGFPAFNQHVEVSTSASVPSEELVRVYPEAGAFFGDRGVFMQMVRYWGDYAFEDDVLEDLGGLRPQAAGYVGQGDGSPTTLLPEPITPQLEPQGEVQREVPRDPRCLLRPDPGPCKGLFERAYFDGVKGVCQEFFYGGCQGVVPFETLDECAATCLGEQVGSQHGEEERPR